jgi:hypothetical protein
MALLRRIEQSTGLRVSTAGFSCLAPGVVITPHTGYHGYSDLIFRVHLGLIVPTDGECALHVAGVTQHVDRGRLCSPLTTRVCTRHGIAARRLALCSCSTSSESRARSTRSITPLYTDELSSLLSFTKQQEANATTSATATTNDKHKHCSGHHDDQ